MAQHAARAGAGVFVVAQDHRACMYLCIAEAAAAAVVLMYQGSILDSLILRCDCGLMTFQPRLVDHVHWEDRKSTRLNSSHKPISYAVFCLKKKNKNHIE